MDETVVVIGDGPSPAGKGWGPEIDRQDAVVRMWDHQWQPVTDYGSRYDFGMITEQASARRAFRRPAISWFFYNVAREPEVAEINGTAIVHLNCAAWARRALDAGAHPESKALKLTRGFAAAAGAIDRLHPRRLFLVGMDMLRDGATTSPRFSEATLAYRTMLYPEHAAFMRSLPGGLPREGPHDHAGEAALIRAFAAEMMTELIWGF